MNRRGPRRGPCGKPQVRGHNREEVPML